MIGLGSSGGSAPAVLGRAALWGGAAFCAVSLGWAAAPVIWRLTGESGQIVPAPSSAPDEPAPQTDLEPVLAFAPFGRDDLPVAQPQAADDSGLGLVLLGVTIGNPVSKSRAIISGGETPVASYPIGARITADADLVEVNADHVVLRVEGRRETLSFARRSAAAAPAARDDPAGPAAGAARPSGNDGAAPEPSDPLEAAIDGFRQALDTDPAGLLDRLGLTPVEGGYRIEGDPAPELARAGFLPGDVIGLVNGRRVGDIDADRQQFDDVVASGQLRVELQRDGQPIAMSFLLR